MGWDVTLDGAIVLKDGRALAALRRAAFEPASELASAPRPFADPIHRPPPTVAAAIDAITDEVFWARAERGRLALRGTWTEDGFRDHAATLASVLSIAARRGATGEVRLVSLGPPLAFTLRLESGGVVVVAHPESAYEAFANEPWVADVMDEVVAVLAPPPAATPSGPIDEAIAALAALDDAALLACAGDLPPAVKVRMKGRPVDQAWATPLEAYPDAASLRAALVEKPSKGKKPAVDDWRRTFALPALAKHDPARAEPLALAVLAGDVDDELAQSAAHALGHCPTDAAVSALFAALDKRALAGFALARNAHPSIVERAIAALDEATVADLYAPSPIPGRYIVSRGGQLVMLLNAKRDPAAVPRLLEIWRQRGRADGARAVGGALASIGTPEGLAATAEAMTDLDVNRARMGAQAFVKLDPASAFERAARLFGTEEPGSARAAAALLSSLEVGPELDPRWLELARRVEGPPNVKAAAEGLLRRHASGVTA